MPNTFADLTTLYTPPTIPGSLGGVTQQPQSTGSIFSETNAAMMQGLSGSDPTAPQPSLPFGSGPMFAAEDISNVGGVTGAAPPVDTKTFIPEIPDPLDIQIDEFVAAEEGFQRTTKSGKVKDKVHEGRKGARKAKKQDRKEDRWARQNADLTGKDKRKTRRAQRHARKGSWKDYKGEMDLKAEDKAAELEYNI